MSFYANVYGALQEAVIYARVSSPAQIKRGDGLGSQETRCREFARMKGYDVVRVFTDDVTGKLATRPGMKDMLQFLRMNRANSPVVIIDDITRLARDVIAHWELRAIIEKAGGRLESPSIEFGEDSDSILVENLLASVSQHQRQKNAEQTKNRMRARTMNGYWCFQAPNGYRYERVAGHGKILVRDEPRASILQEALEGFASGRLETQVDVQQFLECRPDYPQNRLHSTVTRQHAANILTQPLYAGMINVPRWNISMRKGHHEALISLETYLRIQKRLTEGAKTPKRKDLNVDFPLRGAVCCADCGSKLTACWSTGKYKKYPYYVCHNRDCVNNRKSIPRDRIENEFVSLLKSMTPTRELFLLIRKLFCDVWNQRLAQNASVKQSLRRERDSLCKQIDGILDRLIDTSSPSVISAYEKRIAELETGKLLLDEKLSSPTTSPRTFDETFEHAMHYLSNPQKLWISGRYEDRRTVLKLTFSEHLVYCRKTGFRTPEFSMPFKALTGFSAGKKEMVHLMGKSSNTLFEELEAWNLHLKHHWSDAVND